MVKEDDGCQRLMAPTCILNEGLSAAQALDLDRMSRPFRGSSTSSALVSSIQSVYQAQDPQIQILEESLRSVKQELASLKDWVATQSNCLDPLAQSDGTALTEGPRRTRFSRSSVCKFLH